MRATLLIALSLLPAFATGCVGGDDAPGPQSIDDATGPVEGIVAHVGENVVALPRAWRDLIVRLAPTGYAGGEPTLGVTSDGSIFTNPSLTGSPEDRTAKVLRGGEFLVRSQDAGATWEPVGDPIANPKVNLDPWVWVDPVTDRVLHGPLYVACSWLAWSDDRGDSWEFNAVAGCGIPAHDHQKITTGPPAEGVETTGYPNVIYYAYNSFRGEGHWVSVSYDGGQTFSLGQSVHAEDPCHGGIAGGVHAGPDGTAYSAEPICDGVSVEVSHDSGATWEHVTEITGVGHSPAFSNPDIATDPLGNVYVVWPGEDQRMYLATSTDLGQTWSEPKRVSPPHVKGTVFSVLSAGEPGRIAVGYHCTEAEWDGMDPSEAPEDTVWHLCMTFSEDALADEPTFVSEQVTPDDDPVQIGCVWLRGLSNPCRNMLDFIDMVQVGGRPYLVYSDGCNKCTTASESTGRLLTVAIEQAGPSLLGGALPPLVVAAPPEATARR